MNPNPDFNGTPLGAYSTMNISQTIRDRHTILNCAIANDLAQPSRSFEIFLSEGVARILFLSLTESSLPYIAI